MRLSKHNLQMRADYLQKLIPSMAKRITDAPEGKLRISSHKGKNQFYYRTGKEKEKYLGKKELDFIKAVAQKEYDQRVIRGAESELATLKILIKKYEEGIVEDIYDKLASARRELVEPILIPDDEFIRTWVDESYDRLGFARGEPEFLTSRGLRVKSKSEIIIAEKYDEFDIPYKYECPLYLEGFGNVWPDFTVLNIRYRRVKYHEHLGKMDDPEYAERNIKKIKAYEDNGFILGRDLIVTFETKNNPINPTDIERVIKNHLL